MMVSITLSIEIIIFYAIICSRCSTHQDTFEALPLAYPYLTTCYEKVIYLKFVFEASINFLAFSAQPF